MTQQRVASIVIQLMDILDKHSEVTATIGSEDTIANKLDAMTQCAAQVPALYALFQAALNYYIDYLSGDIVHLKSAETQYVDAIIKEEIEHLPIALVDVTGLQIPARQDVAFTQYRKLVNEEIAKLVKARTYKEVETYKVVSTMLADSNTCSSSEKVMTHIHNYLKGINERIAQGIIQLLEYLYRVDSKVAV